MKIKFTKSQVEDSLWAIFMGGFLGSALGDGLVDQILNLPATSTSTLNIVVTVVCFVYSVAKD